MNTIPHIEDLPSEDFIHFTRNIRNMRATEKIDGSNLVFGFTNDPRCQFYTSRESKGGAKYFFPSDYPDRPANNGFRAAHAALQTLETQLRLVMEHGDAVEVEILFGQQPNNIVYGTNTIVFIRSLGQNPQLIDLLRHEFIGSTVSVRSQIMLSTDGKSLITSTQGIGWTFAGVPHVPIRILDQANVTGLLNDFESWLKENPKTNFKTKKEYDNQSLVFKLAIKEMLLDQTVRTMTSQLRTVQVPQIHDFGIEGIVLLNPQTGQQVKLVDKNTFMLINQFNHAIRNQIKETTRFNPKKYEHLYQEFTVRLTDWWDTSFYDELLKRVAVLIGMDGLDRYMGLTRTIKKFSSVKDFVSYWSVTDNSKLLRDLQGTFGVMVCNLTALLNRFKEDYKSYNLVLADGRTVGYNATVYYRTLTSFAEQIQELTSQADAFYDCETLEQFAEVLYSRNLDAIR